MPRVLRWKSSPNTLAAGCLTRATTSRFQSHTPNLRYYHSNLKHVGDCSGLHRSSASKCANHYMTYINCWYFGLRSLTAVSKQDQAARQDHSLHLASKSQLNSQILKPNLQNNTANPEHRLSSSMSGILNAMGDPYPSWEVRKNWFSPKRSPGLFEDASLLGSAPSFVQYYTTNSAILYVAYSIRHIYIYIYVNTYLYITYIYIHTSLSLSVYVLCCMGLGRLRFSVLPVLPVAGPLLPTLQPASCKTPSQHRLILVGALHPGIATALVVEGPGSLKHVE